MRIRRRTFNGTSNRLTKRANGSSKKVPHYARIKTNPTGGSKRRKISLRRRSRRYSSSVGAGPAGAGGLKAEIAAIDAVFNGAVGGANLTKVQVKEALLAHKKAAHPALSDEAKDHMLTLIQSLSQYASGVVITPALLAAHRAAIQAARDAAVSKDVASRSCARPNPLSTPLDHSVTDPKSKPTSPRGKK
jgi:hypothetical protein